MSLLGWHMVAELQGGMGGPGAELGKEPEGFHRILKVGKRSLGSLSPACDQSLPCHIDQSTECHVQSFLRHLQG